MFRGESALALRNLKPRLCKGRHDGPSHIPETDFHMEEGEIEKGGTFA